MWECTSILRICSKAGGEAGAGRGTASSVANGAAVPLASIKSTSERLERSPDCLLGGARIIADPDNQTAEFAVS